MSKARKKLIKAVAESGVLEEKVKAIQSIREVILAAWGTVDLDTFEKAMMATSAAAVCVNIIEAAVREGARSQHGSSKPA